jgi:hypothetical protein
MVIHGIQTIKHSVHYLKRPTKEIPCQDSLEGNLQRVYIRKQSPWKPIQSYDLVSPILEGGCLIKFVYTENDDDDYDYDEETIQVLCNNNNNDDDNNADPEVIDDDLVNFCNTIQNNELYLVNLHGEPNGMRNPTQLQNGMIEVWNEIEQFLITNSSRTTEQQQQQNDFIETELYSIHNDNNDDDNQNKNKNKNIDDSKSLSWKDRIILCGDWNTQLSDINRLSLPWDLSIGLLDNSTGMNFSTNHEYGFIAQYDGCIYSTSLTLNYVKHNTTGFMIKGQNGQLIGNDDFLHYVQNQGVFYQNTFLGNGTVASKGMSDHLRIYTDIGVPIWDVNGTKSVA